MATEAGACPQKKTFHKHPTLVSPDEQM